MALDYCSEDCGFCGTCGEPTGEELFGAPVPGEAVVSTLGDPLAGYTERRHFKYRADGRAFPVSEPKTPDTELPVDYRHDEKLEATIARNLALGFPKTAMRIVKKDSE